MASGPWAPALCELLTSGGIRSRAVDSGDHAALAVEKLLWACIFWLPSTALGAAPVGHLATQHAAEVDALAAELLSII